MFTRNLAHTIRNWVRTISSRPISTSKQRPRVLLWVEALEARDVPSSVPTGTQFQVSPVLAPPENPPAVAITDSATGAFIAAWQSYGQDGDGFGVYAQLFNPDGTYVDVDANGLNDDAFRVNTTTVGNQLTPAVASDGAGHIVFAWQGEDQINGGYNVLYCQASFSGGTLTLGAESQANTLLTAGNQTAPAVAMDAGGEFVLAWQGQVQDPVTLAFDSNIYAKLGTVAGGLAATNEFLVNNTNTVFDQLAPAVAMGPMADSNFLITWQGPAPVPEGEEEAGAEIFGKLFRSDGTPVDLNSNTLDDDTFQVNLPGGHDKVIPTAAMNASGAFVVGWQQEGIEGSGSDIFARRFDASATPLDATNVRLNDTTSKPQRAPAIAMDSAGNVLGTWQTQYQDGFSWSIYAKRYDAGDGAWSGEFQVNDLIVSGPQVAPAVAMSPTGRTVLAWLGPQVPEHGEEVVEGEGGHRPGIHAHLFDAAGEVEVGQELLLNLYSAVEDSGAATAADAAGNFIAVWQSWEDAGDASGFGVYAKLFQANGVPIDVNGNGKDDDAFLVNQTLLSSQGSPAVASDPAGNYVVVWQSVIQVNGVVTGTGIFARRYDASAKQWGPEFQVTTATDGIPVNGNASVPKVGMDAKGNFTVVWQGLDTSVVDTVEAKTPGIFARRFTADGTPGAEFQVNTVSETDQVFPVIAMNPAGQSVIAWVSGHNVENDPVDSEKSIFVRRFDAAGLPIGPEFLANVYVKDAQEHPTLGIDRAGNFVVVWQSINQEMNQEGVGRSWGVYARRYDAALNDWTGPESRVNETVDGSQRFPSVLMDLDGRYIVTWQSIPQDSVSWGVYRRYYEPARGYVGPEELVNTYTAGPQTLPAVSGPGSGDYTVLWSGQGPGHVDGVFGQRFNWIRDDFNRGNFPSLGPDWTVRVGDYDIHDDLAAVVSPTGFATLNQVFLADVAVEAQVTLGGGLVQQQDLVARYKGPNDRNMYLGRLQGREGVFTAEIWRNYGGVWRRLATAPVNAGAGLLRFEVVGFNLKLFLNDRLAAHAYDTAIRGPGLVGMRGTRDTATNDFTYTPVTLVRATVPFRDSFNLTTGSQLSRFWTEQAGAFSVTGNRLVGSGAYNLAVLNQMSGVNVSVQADVNVTTGGAAGLVARHQGTLDQNMFWGTLVNRNGTVYAEIWRNVAGIWTRKVSRIVTTSAGTLRFEAFGPSLKLFLDGTQVAATTDTTFIRGGAVGIRGGAVGFDNFAFNLL